MFESQTAAATPISVCCAAVGAHWQKDYPLALRYGLFGARRLSAERLDHLPSFAAIQPGDLGILVNNFRWRDPTNPPRNDMGTPYGARAPWRVFLERGIFTSYAIFRVDRPAFVSSVPVWDDDWDLRFGFEVLLALDDVELSMSDINPQIANSLRRSAIMKSLPQMITPALLGRPQQEFGSQDLFVAQSAAVLDRPLGCLRREQLLAGRRQAPCAFCGLDCLAEDLDLADLQPRALCDERDRADAKLSVLACPICRQAWSAGLIWIDDHQRVRLNPQAKMSAWRRSRLRGLSGRRFDSSGREKYLAWHRQQIGFGENG